MGRPRTVPRSPAQRAMYLDMMGQLSDLAQRQRNRRHHELQVALLELYAPKARQILIDALTDPSLSPDERYALAATLVSDDD